MPTQPRPSSRSSMDQVLELLADLQDTQISLLLDDLNHTTEGNMPVSQAIEIFEKEVPLSRASTVPSKAPRAPRCSDSLCLDFRLPGKRISSAPQLTSHSRLTTTNSHADSHSADRNQDDEDIPPVPALTYAESCAKTTTPSPPRTPRLTSRITASTYPTETRFIPVNRSYKRISRPFKALEKTASTPDLHDLLLAFLDKTPGSSLASSPITPRSASSAFEPEPPAAIELLEPSPERHVFGRSSLNTSANICGIFEVLGVK